MSLISLQSDSHDMDKSIKQKMGNVKWNLKLKKSNLKFLDYRVNLSFTNFQMMAVFH